MKKITYAGISSSSSFARARENLKELAEVDISISHIQRLTIRVAREYDQQDCESTFANWDKEWVAEHDGDPQQVACISVDGGRAQVREENCGPGVHNPAWIETKVACFQIVQSPELCDDPHPDLPNIFKDKTAVKNIVEGVKRTGPKKGRDGFEVGQQESNNVIPFQSQKREKSASNKPEVIKKYVFADIDNAESFGHAVYYKAHQFKLNDAKRKAFLGDGDRKIWAIYEENFRADDWIPILDFVHAIEYAFEAAKLTTDNDKLCWAKYLEFVTHIWQGRILTVIRRLDKTINELENNSKNNRHRSKDTIETLKSIRSYFQNNFNRMNYPLYRKKGVPVCSCYVESLIKQFNIRFFLPGFQKRLLRNAPL
ncbi:MAG: hypothetical protein A2Y62_14775 [Candidatus Fischerbacteria bacterium RBG_13_37_8]|uniref:ISKra4 family transposase n=1 Tax=Candidatus Fischerbacteria bacterium RBG_13_37_8 TaxID=1817863 RepID=A0A1F5VMS1_9BACT|nr:MAG: hypothetical protein A2Y62_14775 [Candidatus Fischerbacteria bacterium RBG_13_37_8]